MSLPDIGPTITPQDRAAATLIESAVELCREAKIPASVLAPHLDAELKAVYRVETTSSLPIVLRALEAWKPATTVSASSGLLRLTSAGCPIREAAQQDEALCRSCRAMQRELLARSVNVDRGAIEIPRTIIEGDAECEIRVHIARG